MTKAQLKLKLWLTSWQVNNIEETGVANVTYYKPFTHNGEKYYISLYQALDGSKECYKLDIDEIDEDNTIEIENSTFTYMNIEFVVVEESLSGSSSTYNIYRRNDYNLVALIYKCRKQ